MMDQLTYVPVETVYPYALASQDATAALREAFAAVSASMPPARAARLVGKPEQRMATRDALRRNCRSQHGRNAETVAELYLFALECHAAGYVAEQISIRWPAIGNRRQMSLVISLEGSTS